MPNCICFSEEGKKCITVHLSLIILKVAFLDLKNNSTPFKNYHKIFKEFFKN